MPPQSEVFKVLRAQNPTTRKAKAAKKIPDNGEIVIQSNSVPNIKEANPKPSRTTNEGL